MMTSDSLGKRGLKIALALVVIGSAPLACNLPRATATPGLDFPTPNATLTALFSPGGILGTATPEPDVPTVGISTLVPGLDVATSTTGPSQTAAAQNAPTATASATRVLRPDARFEAARLDTPPVIDGIWDEWENPAYPARAIVYGGDSFTGSQDAEGSFRVGWDANNLYLAIKVNDDAYVQNSSGVRLYQGDSVELQLDVDLASDLQVQSLSPDDFQLGLSPGNPDVNGSREAYLWNPPNLAGSKPQITIASAAETGVWRLEAAIPWNIYGVTPAAGQQYGFSLNISDNDNPSENLQQTMISAVAGRELLDPTTWGLLTLVD